jgi:hypothetical protein
MHLPHVNDVPAFQGRILAVMAMAVVPMLIAGYGAGTGRPFEVVVSGLMIWAAGTSLWLRSVWPKLQPATQVDGDARSHRRR